MKKRDGPIVTVDVSLTVAPSYDPNYAVVIDWPADMIVEAARRHPKIFILPFVTTTELDYSKLKELAGETGDFIGVPFFIGNVPEEDRATFIIHYVETVMGPDGKKVNLCDA